MRCEAKIDRNRVVVDLKILTFPHQTLHHELQTVETELLFAKRGLRSQLQEDTQRSTQRLDRDFLISQAQVQQLKKENLALKDQNVLLMKVSQMSGLLHNSHGF